jgi:hypothetical protein
VFPGVKPAAGKSNPWGAVNLKDSPDGDVNESVIGLKESFPENAIAVTMVGEARKFIVRALPSFLDLKLLLRIETYQLREEGIAHRLNDVKIAADFAIRPR